MIPRKDFLSDEMYMEYLYEQNKMLKTHRDSEMINLRKENKGG